MATNKKQNPTTPGRRGMTVTSYRTELSGDAPYKKLVSGFKRGTGRGKGRITSHHKGGGHKRRNRMVDFVFDKKDVPMRVETIEYDPNRSGFIARVVYLDGERRYMLVPQKVVVGAELIVSSKAQVLPGNRTELGRIPVGTFVYNVSLKQDGKAALARSAGTYAEVVAHDAGYTNLKMPSSEVRRVSSGAWASIGEVSNEQHKRVVLGKAGRSRHLGRRPKVRGSAMNPVDHPHGGGEGRAGRGHRRQRTKQGRPTGKGQKTRKPKKYSNKLIVARRKVGKRRK